MKLWRQKVPLENTIQLIKQFVIKATVSVPDPFQAFYNMHFIYLYMNFAN